VNAASPVAAAQWRAVVAEYRDLLPVTPATPAILMLWDGPAAWFARQGLPQPEVVFTTSRTVTVEAGLPAMNAGTSIR
jgi:hypothetical protein